MKLTPIIFIFFLILFICTSCRQPDKNDDYPVKVERDIPYEKGDTSWYYKAIHRNLGKVHLNELRNGFDSLQIRIWFAGTKENESRVFVIQKQKAWSAIIYRIVSIPELDSIKSIEPEFMSSPPRSGWNNFIGNLVDLAIVNLPDYTTIKNFADCMDYGTDVTVEIASINNYRIYSYPCIEENKFPEVDSLNRIFSYISSEFQKDLRN